MTWHTPTPWRYEVNHVAPGVQRFPIYDAEDNCVGLIYSAPSPYPREEVVKEAVRAANSHAALLAVLRAVEWVEIPIRQTTLLWRSAIRCPSCGAEKSEHGHAPDCPLAKALRDAEGE